MLFLYRPRQTYLPYRRPRPDVTVAEFRGDRICSLRQYWDELSLFEQLGLLPEG
jgi:hypothetical protein